MAIPLGRMFAVGVDLLITLVVVLIAIALYRTGFRWEMLLVPVFILLSFVTATGLGLPLAAVNVKYRDIGMALPLAIQLWLFLTPVLYPGSLVTGNWQYIYALNPMVTAVQGTRWALLGTPPPSAGAVFASVAVAVLLLIGGTLYFRRAENNFADII
jgi:lipopolysaccharide transport system permease protein